MATNMSRRDLREWAKEEVRDALHELFKKFKTDNPEATVDEFDALRKQANIALKAIRMPDLPDLWAWGNHDDEEKQP